MLLTQDPPFLSICPVPVLWLLVPLFLCSTSIPCSPSQGFSPSLVFRLLFLSMTDLTPFPVVSAIAKGFLVNCRGLKVVESPSLPAPFSPLP